MLFTNWIPLLAATAYALPSNEKRLVTRPSVTINSGTVNGASLLGVESFRGIPYAAPPVGDLRLRPPQPFSGSFGNLTATGIPTACPQGSAPVQLPSILPGNVTDTLRNLPIFSALTASTGEDCLTVDVFRPAGIAANASLPVLFWIYGGSFESGSTQIYSGSPFVRRSVSLDQPIIFVQVNYRVGGFGFMGGADLAAEGSTNLGLRDQRLALQWVADNIAAFGGDPSKVTIFGESAGSISVWDQMIINGGDNTYNGRPLFRAAIMNSGSVVPAMEIDTVKPQRIYDTVVREAGCATAADRLACLRAVDYPTLLRAATSVPDSASYTSINLSYLPRPDPRNNFFPVSPEVALNNGAYTRVPVITGDQQDEGTLFSLFQTNITTNERLVEYLVDFFEGVPDVESEIRQLLEFYPDRPLLGQPNGAPYNTGILNNIYPQFKRIAAVLGDVSFIQQRRNLLQVLSAAGINAWGFSATNNYGVPILGTFHASDVLAMFFVPGLAAQTYQSYYVGFTNNLNPNTVGTTSLLINWPQYTPGSSPSNILELRALRNVIRRDDQRTDVTPFIKNSGLRV